MNALLEVYELAPLFYAVQSRKYSLDLVRLLLESGADASHPESDVYMTVLHRAADWNDVPLAELPVTHGAALDARDDCDETPPHYAARMDAKDVAALLLDSGASPDLEDCGGRTPVDAAAEGDSQATVGLLRDVG